MKKAFVCVLLTAFALALAACGQKEAAARPEPAPAAASVKEAEQKEQDMKIKVTDGKHTVVFVLNKSKAAASLYGQLPLTVQVENYSDNEKIFYPQKLNTEGAERAVPKEGTLAYFAPWGNVVMFYREHSSTHSGLLDLGQAVSGKEVIKNLSGTLKITKAEEQEAEK